MCLCSSELLKFVTEHRPVPEGDNDPNSRQVIRAKKDSFRKVLLSAVGAVYCTLLTAY